MNNGQVKSLCLGLLRAETEEDVIELLTKAGYWDQSQLWRHYGDVENNWGQGGNQQSLAEAALAEKIVNSVDARLIDECLERGIDPKGSKAPRTIKEAVARFFEDGTGEQLSVGGLIDEWSDEKIRRVAEGITLCATGTRPVLNLTISDCGEGQTPRRLPLTILSLSKSNKMYIPFVQGQFNQGGTGALRFCGNHNLQLVVSRRNPKLIPDDEEEGSQWGFTIVRRERPEGGRRNSVYTFLAPVGVGETHLDGKGEVLSFSSAGLPIYPDKNEPYGREAQYGTAIKLFEYKYLGERSNIIRGRSILSRLDLLLPEVALPVRVYEFRKNQAGKYLDSGSRETSLTGLKRRLANTKNVEPEFPITIPFAPEGEQLFATVYAFKPVGTSRDEDEGDEDDSPKKKLGGLTRYRKREGVLFVRNGQTQGSLPKDFFRRDTLKLKPLADELLVFVECDRMSDPVREDLFMPSRDRLTDIDFKAELIDGLEHALRDDETLRQLRNRRQAEQMTERMKDDKPLADVLQHLIRSSPNLTALLQLGHRITAPFNPKSTNVQEKPFKGEVYPTFFRMKGAKYGDIYHRECPINYRMRLAFETDARDDYFSRRIEGGKFELVWLDRRNNEHKASIVGPNLRNGLATVMVSLPTAVEVGDLVRFIARTSDTRNEFDNLMDVSIKPWAEHREGGARQPADRKSPSNAQGKDREQPHQLAIPKIDRVYRDRWQKVKFDEYTAMKMDTEYDDDDNDIAVFRVNMDNTPLLNEIKQRRLDEAAARNQFMYANVLMGLSLLLDNKEQSERRADGAQQSVEERIDRTCKALAPFMLSLTSLGQQDLGDGEFFDGLEAAAG